MSAAAFRLAGLGFAYDQSAVLHDVSMEWQAGEWVAICGPNGAGKSTLLTICAGLRGGYTGTCEFQGRGVGRWARRAFARKVAFVPQTLRVEFPFSAEQVVLMGRTPFGDGLFEGEEDFAVARRAMERCDCMELAKRDFRELSGGERQRVVLAAALAQSPEALLLDEPAAFLDLKHQQRMHGVLSEVKREGTLVVSVTHDLNHAAVYADKVVLLEAGRVRAFGTAREVLTPERIREVFAVEAELVARRSGGQWIAYGL
ncbi:MAG: ABC transporter ATP-binding protein [Acidobacteria bacterium]|nr:ABC transporter ATP-binding protein [Acidobacteriota bacterium]